jgi:hypothetical protein
MIESKLIGYICSLSICRKKYTDQTGRFPVISSRGNVIIMVLYEYDGNAIMAEPIKNAHFKSWNIN